MASGGLRIPGKANLVDLSPITVRASLAFDDGIDFRGGALLQMSDRLRFASVLPLVA